MAMRRCRDHRLGGRSNKERIKFERNSNITSNRVTIFPSFLCHRIIQKSPIKFGLGYDSERDFAPTNGRGVNENRHKPRRPARISRKTEEAHNYTQQTAPKYYYNGLQNSPARETPKNSSRIVRNNSNSLFREINERWSRLEPRTSNGPVSDVVDPHSNGRFYPSVFCANLLREVTLDLKPYDPLANCRLAIADKMGDINRQLSGKMDLRHGDPEKTKQTEVDDEQNYLSYIPRSAWVFQTPPKQRVAVPKPAESAIRPAVICTADKCNDLYELHPGFHVDLTDVSGGENMGVNGRYMRHLASFGENGEAVGSFGTGHIQEGYSHSQSILCNLFTGRPAKTVKTKSREEKFCERRGRDGTEDTPTGVDLFESGEEFDGDVTFVRDNGTFRMVNTHSRESESFEFKFRKNLFKGDEEKVFDFDTKEPKMFNFVKLDKKGEKFKKNLFKADDEKMFNFDTKELGMSNFSKIGEN